MKSKAFIKQNFWFLLVLAATAIHLAISLKLAIYWYDNFNLGKYDLGNAVQVVNNTLHGKFFTYTDRFGTQISRLSNHADFILLLLVPLFAVFPSPVTLIVAQCLALSVGGLIIYFLARAVKLSKFASFLISLAYFLNSDVGYLGLDAFHGITFVIPFVLLSFYFLERYYSSSGGPMSIGPESRSKVSGSRLPRIIGVAQTIICEKAYLYGFFISTFLVLISKEEASLLVALLGLYIWLVKKQKKLGLALAAVGLGWFAVYFLIVSPAYGPVRQTSVAQFAAQFPELVSGTDYAAAVRENPFISRYSHLGSNIKEILLSPILKPGVFVRGAFNWPYLLRLLGPVGFVALLAPAVLMLALPEYLINVLSSGGSMAQKYYGVFHYISLLIPVVFYAVILGVKRASRLFGSSRTDLASLAFSGFAFLASGFFAFREHNPVLVNPITIVSQRLAPMLGSEVAMLLDRLVGKSEIAEMGAVPPLELVAKDKEGLTAGSEREVSTTGPFHAPTVYITNPKHSGGDLAIYSLLKNQVGAISGPSSLGAKLVVRENYNLFPVHWQGSRFVAANFTGAPKTLGSVGVVFGLGVDASAAGFLRDAVWKIENNLGYGVLHSGDGLLVFEQGITQPLFEYVPVLEQADPVGTSRAVVFYNFNLPEDFTRGTAQSIEFGWEVDESLVMEKGANELLEGAPFIAFCAEGDRVADFYEVLYGLFLSLDRTEGPQRVQQLITFPEGLEPGEYKVYFGWYELLNFEMPGHAKLKDALKLGSVEVR